MANIYDIFFTIVTDISKECFKYNLKLTNFINKQEYESLTNNHRFCLFTREVQGCHKVELPSKRKIKQQQKIVVGKRNRIDYYKLFF